MPKIRVTATAQIVALFVAVAALVGVILWLWLRPGAKSAPTLNDQIESLRQLERAEEWTKLSEALDRSTILVPEGNFVRGSDVTRWDERPEQSVFLDSFEIDQFEVTNIQYERFVQATGCQAPPYWNGNQFPAGQADYPVTGVTFDQANAYCQWAGKRLPTEAEWEKACRGTDGRIYPWGHEWQGGLGNTDPLAGSFKISNVPVGSGPALGDDAWSFLRASASASEDRGLKPVGSYLGGASPFGVMDMVGNVSEWVSDWYVNADYSQLPLRNPQTLEPHWNHALRGSTWYDPNGGPDWVKNQSRCSARNSSHDLLDARIGLRCARSVR